MRTFLLAGAVCLLTGCQTGLKQKSFKAIGIATTEDISAIREEAVDSDEAFLAAINSAPEGAEPLSVMRTAAESRLDSSTRFNEMSATANVDPANMGFGALIMILLGYAARLAKRRFGSVGSPAQANQTPVT